MKIITAVLPAFTAILLIFPVVTSAQEMKASQQNMPVIEQLLLGTSIQNKELSGQDSTFNVRDKVYLWMMVTGATGDSLVLTWKHGDNSYETKLSIGGSPWRTWAYKTVAAAGEWSITVSTQSGQILKTKTFTVK